MTRSPACLAWVLACALAACFRSHPADRVELMGTDCAMCHLRDYQATTAPVHPATPQVFTTACARCHRTLGWQPALEGLHRDTFVIATGPHAPVACLDCHQLDRGASKAGANTDCVGCHPDDARQRAAHADLVGVGNPPYAYQADVPNFCLTCHPSGLADQHPDDKFARRGDHDVPCGACHDRAAGPDTAGRNVTCVDARCHHTLAVSDRIGDHQDAKYDAARGAGASRNFCHQCHR